LQPITLKVKRLAHCHDLPRYATAGSAGLDLTAGIDTPITIEPGKRTRVPTGLIIEVPPGYEGQVRPRSGLAVKHGISLPNTPATIDSDYRGEIRVPVINLGQDAFRVSRGMRIAQLVIAPVARITWDEVRELPGTARAGGGFGHSGV